jgi:hypothetical protein
MNLNMLSEFMQVLNIKKKHYMYAGSIYYNLFVAWIEIKS